MESRRIQRIGERSFSVTLPKAWIQSKGLREQDLIFFEQTQQGDLLLSSTKGSLRQKLIMEVQVDEIDALPEFIVLCYTHNVQSMRLLGSLDFKKTVQIKQTLKHLEGFVITAENERSIELSFLFKDVDIILPTILQRMTYLLKMMVAALKQGDRENLQEFEDNMDRLHHLAKRILNACVYNPALRATNKLQAQEEVFFFRAMIKRLENIGDRICSIKMPKQQDIIVLNGIVVFIEKIILRQDKIKDLKSDYAILCKHQEEINPHAHRCLELVEDILENYISIIYDRQYFTN